MQLFQIMITKELKWESKKVDLKEIRGERKSEEDSVNKETSWEKKGPGI